VPRIEPLSPPYEPELERLLVRMTGTDEVEPLKLFRTLAVHEEIVSRMRPLGSALLAHPTIEPRDREIVIHRTTARCGAEYEWGVHAVAFGRPLGLDDAQLAATVHGAADDPAWSEHDRLLIELVDELDDTATVSDGLWSRLAAVWSPLQLVELVVLAGWYRLISQVVNACGVEHEEWAERFPPAPG
jgi:alkylhydroperoxidase family enzyme